MPVFIVAGFLEGFVTRYSEMPWLVSLLIIGGSLAFVVWYFALYPFRLNQRQQHAGGSRH